MLFVVTATFQTLLYRTHDRIEDHVGLVIGLMWGPAFASLVARLALREGARNVSLRWGGAIGTRMALSAWLFPLVVGPIAYGAAWLTGLEHFHVPAERALVFGSKALTFARSLALTSTLGVVFSAVSATGEELGWRGYMLTRLFDAGVKRPVFVSGVVWGLWHVPLIVSGQYAAGRYPFLSAALFVPSIIASSYVAARVRLESGSVWPAVIFHSAWNSIIQGSFDRYTFGGDASHATTLWTGESGILVVAVSVVAAIWWVRRGVTMRRYPFEEAEPYQG